MRALIAIFFLLSFQARADWSGGLGYHNPAESTLGLNLMYLWTDWAIELGVGYIGSSEHWNDKNTTYSVGGDLNLKYLFSSGFLRPYLTAGFADGLATSKSSVSAGANISNPFGGGGIFLMGTEVYVYLSYLILNTGEFQAGFGIPF